MEHQQPPLKPGDYVALRRIDGAIDMAHIEFLHNGRIVLGYGKRTDAPEARIHSTKTLPEVLPFVCDIWRVTGHTERQYTTVEFNGQRLAVTYPEPLWTMIWSRRVSNELDSTNQG